MEDHYNYLNITPARIYETCLSSSKRICCDPAKPVNGSPDTACSLAAGLYLDGQNLQPYHCEYNDFSESESCTGVSGHSMGKSLHAWRLVSHHTEVLL